MANKITSCDVRMYTMGTGDCFVLSFKDDPDGEPLYQLMIDCGVYNITGPKMKTYADDIIDFTNGEVDALLITHEHQDHVLGFQRAKKTFVEGLKVKELWLPWTENEKDRLVKTWKKAYGKKKKALALAASRLSKSTSTELFNSIYTDGSEEPRALGVRKKVANHLLELSDLNTERRVGKVYIGGLKGMDIVKNDLEKERTRYLHTGTIVEDIDGLDNIRIYVLGPPRMWRNVKKEHGKEGETYKHNKELELVQGFSSMPFEDDLTNTSPFDPKHIVDFKESEYVDDDKEKHDALQAELATFKACRDNYEADTYRRIDFDWLMSAANLSLRLTRGINNLSAVLAIEFVDSGKVMLFPGDAEYGSWRTWNNIKWDEKGKDGTTHLTTDLLNRTVFYKVAHHLSHNGTAREEGLDLMTNRDLVAMATLDFDNISTTWTNTMPNKALLADLLQKTQGRLLVTSLNKLFFDKKETIALADEIENRLSNLSATKRKAFEDRVTTGDKFVEYRVDGGVD